MANLSDASVEIKVEKVGREFLNYAKLSEDSDYAIITEHDETVNPDKNGDISISSFATGRWAYTTNLEGYFDGKMVKGWLGVDSDRSWLPESKREEYKQRADRIYEAYKDLCHALIETNGKITINYTDIEGGNGFIEKGEAVIEVIDGKVELNINAEESDYNVVNYMEVSGEDLFGAIMTLHGDEAMEAYFAQSNEGERTAAHFDSWYENYEG